MLKATLITGVAGTTGSQILDYLLDESEEIKSGKRIVVGVDNFFRGCIENISHHVSSPSFEFTMSDFRGLIGRIPFVETKNGSPARIDEVYHMAAVVPTHYFYDSPDLTYAINCKGTIDLFNWCREVGIKRFIVGSSSEIYGHICSEDLPAKETTMSHFDSEEDSTRWSYAEGKLLTEHYLNHFKNDMERVCHLRFANTYGVRDMDDNHIVPYLINSVVQGKDIHINKDCMVYKRTFLNNKDSARACVELMSKGKNGVAYNVGSQEEISIYDLFRVIEDLYKELTGKTYSGQVFKDIHRPGDPLRRVLSTQRLKEDTGFSPVVKLEEGLTEMLKVAINKENSKNGKNS